MDDPMTHLQAAREYYENRTAQTTDPERNLRAWMVAILAHLEALAGERVNNVTVCSCEDRWTYTVPDPNCPMHGKPQETVTTSANSSAPTTGRVEKHLPLPNVSLAEALEHSARAITDCFKSMPYIEAEWMEILIDSSTLKLTLAWPTQSGSTRDGFHGHVPLEVDDESRV